MKQKKRHHFVPQTYLESFCNPAGRILVYRKDGDGTPLPLVPNATQFQRYYYSQPKPDGGRDNNTLEDFFSEYESAWQPLVKKLEARVDINDDLETLFSFMALQRARVPACRDAVERTLAATVKNVAKQMYQDGHLPPLPTEYPNLLEDLEVAIDPHQSIHAMVVIIQAMGPLIDSLGWVVFHNNSETPFLSSDNPVAWFDPSLPFAEQKPYGIIPNGPVVVQFPVSPRLVLIGATEYRDIFISKGLIHADAPSDEWVKGVNAQTCRFGYEAVLASTESQEQMISDFADISPVLTSQSLLVNDSRMILHSMEFGRRSEKPKWQGDAQQEDKK
ncbi:hypothetical protein B7H19_15610 [Pseudomonas putida]|uniref:DUF4238 domain-containing protein n=1 Tax=Pseudomonas putida TaxID=303 RepID=UPI000A106D05|nr:DUF4238 domain-containing protein [Pseudomonas putida]ORL68378.1 hypothetical protein B7H19_15610 [Pseudomonas putida]